MNSSFEKDIEKKQDYFVSCLTNSFAKILDKSEFQNRIKSLVEIFIEDSVFPSVLEKINEKITEKLGTIEKVKMTEKSFESSMDEKPEAPEFNVRVI